MKQCLGSRWRPIARDLYIKHGGDVQACRREMRQTYGSIMTILAILQGIMFLYDLWKRLHPKPTDVPEMPSELELEQIEFVNEE